MDTTTLSIDEIKGLIRRRAKLFFLIFSLILIGMTVLAIALPPIYRSQAVIVIESQQIPDEFVKSTVTSYAEQRLEMITRDILRSSALKQIINEFDLYSDIRKNGNMGLAIEEMKEAVGIEPISSKEGRQTSTVAFILSYEGKNPQKVYEVTNRLSNLYLEKETETREKQAAVTTRFMEAELENLKKQIAKHEQIVSEFKKKHIGELPGSASANLSTLERLDRELDQAESRIRALQDRKIYLKGQLANVEPLKPIQTQEGKVARNPAERLKGLRLELIRLRSRLSEKHPDVRKLMSEIAELEGQVGSADEAIVKVKQLRTLRAQLAEQQAGKGSQHPDVINLSRQVETLSKEVDKLLTDKAMLDVSEQKPDNPLYIDLSTQIVAADAEIRNINEDIQKINAMRREYQSKVENAPIIEKEYNELTLDYANAKQRYNDVLSKLLEARVAQEMEIQQQGERFSITDPAYLPSRPYKPNRLAIILLGFVLALAGGFGGVVFREASDNTIKSSKDINDIDGIELLTAMPYTPTEEELLLHRRKKLVLVTGGMGILGVLLIMVDRLIWPLRDVFSIVVDRLSF